MVEPKSTDSTTPNTNDKHEGDRLISDFSRPQTRSVDSQDAPRPDDASAGGSNTENTDAAPAATPADSEESTPEAALPTGIGETDSETKSSDTTSPEVFNSTAVVSDSKPGASRKVLLIVIFLLLLAALGIGAYLLVTLKSANTTPAAATATVKNDVQNIRYVTTNTGWDKFYPGIDNTSSYLESNSQIFEGLVRYENRTKIVPLLATSWTNPDVNTWVFQLKKGVKFHSGREMTADDVKASFSAAKDTAFGQEFGNTISSVTVDNPYQVTIKTSTPDSTLLNKLTMYYVYDTKSGKTDDPINGTGAYTIKPGTTAKYDSLELVAFDQYHGGRPHVRSVSYVGLSDNDQGKAYQDNKASLMTFFSDAPTAVTTRKYTQVNLDPWYVQDLALNTLKANSPLGKVQVRTAIKDALDQASLAKAKGVTYQAASQMVTNAVPGFNPNIPAPKQDAAAAKQLLTSAGYPKGFSMKLTYYKTSAVQSQAEELAKELAAIGVTVNLDPQTDTSALGSIAFGGKTDAFLISTSTDIFDSSDVLTNFDDTANYHSQPVIDLVNKSLSTLDASQHISYLQQANKAMADDAGVIPLFVQADKNSIIYDPSLVIQRDVDTANLGIYFWKAYAK